MTAPVSLLTTWDRPAEEVALNIRRPGTVRSATLKGYAEAAAAVGLDPRAMIVGVGLRPECLTDPDMIIPISAFFELLTQSARAANCRDFGARAAVARGIPDLGALTLLMREAEDVEAAIRLFGSHVTLHADDTVISLDTGGDCPFVVTQLHGITREQSVQALQFAVNGVIMQIRWLTGTNFCPEFIAYSYERPAGRRDMLSLFPCPTLYSQAVSGIGITRATLAQPLVTSPPFLRKLALEHLGSILRRPPDSYTARVGRLVRQLLPEGQCNSGRVADLFEIDRRTLSRWLEREGETFSSVVQQVRLEIAGQGFRDVKCSLTDLSVALGFTNLSSFSRWFRAHFGSSATGLRNQPTVKLQALSPTVP